MMKVQIDFGDGCWWHILVTNFGDKFWWHILVTNFGDRFWWQMLVTNISDRCWWWKLVKKWWQILPSSHHQLQGETVYLSLPWPVSVASSVHNLPNGPVVDQPEFHQLLLPCPLIAAVCVLSHSCLRKPFCHPKVQKECQAGTGPYYFWKINLTSIDLKWPQMTSGDLVFTCQNRIHQNWILGNRMNQSLFGAFHLRLHFFDKGCRYTADCVILTFSCAEDLCQRHSLANFCLANSSLGTFFARCSHSNYAPWRFEWLYHWILPTHQRHHSYYRWSCNHTGIQSSPLHSLPNICFVSTKMSENESKNVRKFDWCQHTLNPLKQGVIRLSHFLECLAITSEKSCRPGLFVNITNLDSSSSSYSAIFWSKFMKNRNFLTHKLWHMNYDTWGKNHELRNSSWTILFDWFV